MAEDRIPLTVQAVQHLSPGCRCEWSTFSDFHGGFPVETVGITGQAEDCPVHPIPKQLTEE